MQATVLKADRYVLNKQKLSNWAFIAYFCLPMIQLVVNIPCKIVGVTELSRWIAWLIAYLPVILIPFVTREKDRAYIEFLAIFFFLITSLCVTIIIHPDYWYWYTRETYGVMPYVFRPDNGIYAFLFICIVNDSKEILKNLRIVGFVMYIYYAWQLLSAMRRGYWLVEDSIGNDMKLSYSLDFGYSMMFIVLIFLYYALSQKKPIDIILSIGGIIMLLLGGSRGAFIGVGVLLLGYVFIAYLKSKKKIAIIFAIIISIFLIFYFYEAILYGLAGLFESLGLQSRFIYKLLNGSILDGTGRDNLWNASIEMIQQRPITGHGAMGARPVISKIHNVGYPHQLFLELLIEYGVIFGGAICLILIIGSIRLFFLKGIGEWKFVFLIFFANASELMLSYTYWHKQALWAALAAGICAYHYHKSTNKIHRESRRTYI